MKLDLRINVLRGLLLLFLLKYYIYFLKSIRLNIAAENIQVLFIKKSSLFDKKHYMSRFHLPSNYKPLRHYICIGDDLGIEPLPLFDPNYYRSKVKSGLKDINTLIHYIYLGRYLGIPTCPWFDTGFYLENNPDVGRSNINPLKHFLQYGGFEGRSSSSIFNLSLYLEKILHTNSEKINPLVYYVYYERLNANTIHLKTPLTMTFQGNSDYIKNISLEETQKKWGLYKERIDSEALIDVIMPVYKGFSETLKCINSVLNSNCSVRFNLIIINDDSPDTEINNFLRKLAQQGMFELIENKSNLGFVKTVNSGMSFNQNRDVVLLNSDTEVYNNWLDRLYSTSLKHSNAATITPLSNNATICSYPIFLEDNNYPLEVSYSDLDDICAKNNQFGVVQAPTGVGFCMYIKRAALKDIGYFDEVAFGKGYGEENDFCQRAIEKGWVNLIVPDVFVRHFGSTSFQNERAERVKNALQVLNTRYPHYDYAIRSFIHKDPLSIYRTVIDMVRLQRLCKARNVLIVCHQRGGGTERHIQEDIRKLESIGYGVFILRPYISQALEVYIEHPHIKRLYNFPTFSLCNVESIFHLISSLKITEIHTHSFVDFGSNAANAFSKIIEFLEFKKYPIYWEANIHDYEIICPRISLINEKGFYCGELGENECYQCLKKNGFSFGVVNINHWREMNYTNLRKAKVVSVPNLDVLLRLEKYFPLLSYKVDPHDNTDEIPFSFQKRKKDIFKIIVIGAISKKKGFDILLETAKLSKKHNLPFTFQVFGYSMDDELLEAGGVKVLGKYDEVEALELLQSLDADVVWLPSLWPETYSYTLSLAFQAKLPIMAFDIGAIATRLRSRNQTNLVMPLKEARNPDYILSLLKKELL